MRQEREVRSAFDRFLDPRGYEAVLTAALNDIEKAHHYLWRFWRAVPKDGHMTILIGQGMDVMVERIEGFSEQQNGNCIQRDQFRWSRILEDHG